MVAKVSTDTNPHPGLVSPWGFLDLVLAQAPTTTVATPPVLQSRPPPAPPSQPQPPQNTFTVTTVTAAPSVSEVWSRGDIGPPPQINLIEDMEVDIAGSTPPPSALHI